MEVVACILIKKKKLLISSRPSPKESSGYFEFPGGKVEKGEFLLEALSRELNEEININIKLSRVIFLTNYQIKRKINLNLNFFVCDQWYGSVTANENQNIHWVSIKRISDFNILKSNNKVIKRLQMLNLFPGC